MFQSFLIKYGEIGIKGKNRYLFEDALVKQMKLALEPVEGEFTVTKEQGRVYVFCPEKYDFDEAVEQAVWLEHGNRHSAHIHSKNIDNITKYAKAIDTAILVKNGPSYSALGFGGEGFCTFTIASRTGEGLTSASTFTKRRRCVMTDSLCIR